MWVRNSTQVATIKLQYFVHSRIRKGCKYCPKSTKTVVVQEIQKGEIGIALNSHWFVPAYETKQDIKAKLRALDFMFGWQVNLY